MERRLANASIAGCCDGYGDSGISSEVKRFDSDYYTYQEHKPLLQDAAYLREHFETLVHSAMKTTAAFGDVVLDVSTRKITVERNDRFEDYTTSIYDI